MGTLPSLTAKQTKERRDLLAIDLELLRSQFALAKLEKREDAQMELQAS